MREYRTLEAVTTDYFVAHPEEVEPFLNEVFVEYAESGDSGALLAALRIVARTRGISQLASEIGMTRQGLQKALSTKGNPRLDNIQAIMKALGYQLLPVKS